MAFNTENTDVIEQPQDLGVPATIDELSQLISESPPSPYADEKALTEVTKVGDYLPFIQLMGGSSKEVKKGEFPMGHFCLKQGKKMIDLGTSFVCMVLAWRSKAMIFEVPPVSYFDHRSEEFKKIQAHADDKNSGMGFGPELLFWLPDHNTFATYFMGNKTGRNESTNVIGVIKEAKKTCRLESTLIDDGRNSWHGPMTKAYDLDIKMPPMDSLRKELEKFKNPPLTPVKESAEGTRAR